MAKAVISHRRPRRKRADALGWASRRFGALAVTVAALAAATWLAPPRRSPAPPSPARIEAPSPAPAERVEISVELAAPPVRPARRSGHRTAPDAPSPSDGYEILTAAELDAISQARAE